MAMDVWAEYVAITIQIYEVAGQMMDFVHCGKGI